MQTATLPQKYRIASIDLLRGAIMIIMALDHVRDFFHVNAMLDDPTNLATTTPLLFFTRWITHFCAPVFVFLTGVSAFISGQRKTKKQASAFLFKRGLWLILVELVIVTLGLTFDPGYHLLFLQVIWVIGWSMIFLSVIIYLPVKWIAAIALVIITGHNLLDRFDAKDFNHISIPWAFLHQQYFFPYVKGHVAGIVYPLFPWPAVMMLGYAVGSLYKSSVDANARRRRLLLFGIATTVLFVVLRLTNIYGDPSKWSAQKNNVFTVISFLNTTKYPPSLLYLCMTLGPGMILLSFFETVRSKFSKVIVIYGRVPMFYYLVHFYLIHIVCVVIFFAQQRTSKEMAESFLLFRPNHFGFNLPVVYAIWLSIVIALYPLCRWYNKYKSTHTQWWLSYL
ncbi:MAG: hypothetical protein JWN76_3351 [Chitinophagaceae bacterium]|nr:hypothetical protein [Chitinophagaceae bacterium]